SFSMAKNNVDGGHLPVDAISQADGSDPKPAEKDGDVGHLYHADVSSRQHFPSVSHPAADESLSHQTTTSVHRVSAYSVAQEQLTRVAAAMNLDEDMVEYLRM